MLMIKEDNNEKETQMTKTEWMYRYAVFMQTKVIGGISYQYCHDSAEAYLDAIGDDWLDTTPEEGVLSEMSYWDD